MLEKLLVLVGETQLELLDEGVGLLVQVLQKRDVWRRRQKGRRFLRLVVLRVRVLIMGLQVVGRVVEGRGDR